MTGQHNRAEARVQAGRTVETFASGGKQSTLRVRSIDKNATMNDINGLAPHGDQQGQGIDIDGPNAKG